MKLQDIVKNYRKDNSLSLRVMADRCGCSHQYLSYLEKGYEGNHSIEKLQGLAKGMNITFDELLDMLDDEFVVSFEKSFEDSKLTEIDKLLANTNDAQKDEVINFLNFIIARDKGK